MVFSSMSFLFAFLPLVLLFYYASSMKIKNIILMLSGILFYAWGEPFYVIIMIVSILIDYTSGIIMNKYDENKGARFFCLLTSVILNVGLLSTFKYSSFIIENINALFNISLPNPNLPLPIGISFFTFQSMSYTIDLYMRKIKVQKNIISFTSFVTLFPQIVAGPIVRYADVAKEIDDRSITYDKVANGIGIFIKGLAKKVLLANNIGALWAIIKAMDYETLPVATAWIGILAFTFQIYFDFSGYSDMAIGLGKMLGFNFPKNFDHPYMSKSISEFWRRWHMTLGGWFKSYVYFPMGGNRCSTLKNIRNLVVVWFLTGLWHGASWNFVLWGVFYGVIIICEKYIWGKALQKLPNVLQWLYSFLLVVFGWVLFEMNTMGKIGSYFGAMFGLNGGGLYDSQTIYLFLTNLLIFIACGFCSTTILKRIFRKYKKSAVFNTGKVLVQICVFVACICYLVNSAFNPFLYFNF